MTMKTDHVLRRRTLIGLSAVATSALWPSIGIGQAKVVRFILPVATASGVDTITRASSQALSAALGYPVVVENQPGAGGIVGTSAMTKSPPDGFTLSIVSNNHVIYPSVYKSLPFDPINDITPIAIVGSTPIVFVVNPKVPAKDAKELIALLKAKPGGYNYASSGNGTSLPSIQPHLKSGALRAIGTGTASRLAAAPDILTMTEQGMPGYLVEG